jgi:hypothetical protein
LDPSELTAIGDLGKPHAANIRKLMHADNTVFNSTKATTVGKIHFKYRIA